MPEPPPLPTSTAPASMSPSPSKSPNAIRVGERYRDLVGRPGRHGQAIFAVDELNGAAVRELGGVAGLAQGLACERRDEGRCGAPPQPASATPSASAANTTWHPLVILDSPEAGRRANPDRPACCPRAGLRATSKRTPARLAQLRRRRPRGRRSEPLDRAPHPRAHAQQQERRHGHQPDDEPPPQAPTGPSRRSRNRAPGSRGTRAARSRAR